MKKILTILLAVLLAINIVSLSPTSIFAEGEDVQEVNDEQETVDEPKEETDETQDEVGEPQEEVLEEPKVENEEQLPLGIPSGDVRYKVEYYFQVPSDPVSPEYSERGYNYNYGYYRNGYYFEENYDIALPLIAYADDGDIVEALGADLTGYESVYEPLDMFLDYEEPNDDGANILAVPYIELNGGQYIDTLISPSE